MTRFQLKSKQVAEFVALVLKEGHEYLRDSLNGDWAKQVLQGGRAGWTDARNALPPQVFAFRLLYEEGQWSRFNDCVKVIHASLREEADHKALRHKVGLLPRGGHAAKAVGFELFVVGSFAKDGVLTRIDVPVNEQSRSNVDAAIRFIEGRTLLVEATCLKEEATAEGVWSDLLGRHLPFVGCVDPERPVENIRNSLRKKTRWGKQLGLVKDEPTLVVLGLTPTPKHDPMLIPEDLECKLCRWPGVSALIVSDTHHFIRKKLYVNPAAEVRLSPIECGYLAELCDRRGTC